MVGPDDKDMLFDLLADPGESTDITGQNPDLVKSMKEKLFEFRESCKKSLSGADYSHTIHP